MYSVRMINTFNEKSLHKTIKKIIALESEGKTEVPVASFICDVVGKDNHIYEIQTKNLGKIKNKVEILLKTHTVTVIYPLCINTFIETYSEDNQLISKRKSPKKRNIYSVFDELMGIYNLLLLPNFTFEVWEVEKIEERIKTVDKKQLINRSRKFLKQWIPLDTKLKTITTRHTFENKDDYIALLPNTLPDSFSTKDIAPIVGKQTHKMVWTFKKANIIKLVDKKGNLNLYSIT